MLFASPLHRLRLAGWFEGATLLALLFVAVPMKRLFDLPEAVTAVGPVHGFAFVLYLVLLADASVGASWPWRRTVLAFAAALVPFGTFAFDRTLRRSAA